MNGDAERPALRGDEAALFEAFDDELRGRIVRSVKTSRANIDDACSFASEQFLEHQPDRDRNWRSWLTKVAERQAWRLDESERRHVAFNPPGGDHGVSPPDSVNPQDQALDIQVALAEVSQLPPRLGRIAMMRGFGLAYSEISELTGDSTRRIGQLASRANQRLADLRTEREAQPDPRSPRARRLEELTQDTPAWLASLIGRAPGRKQSAAAQLAWRRAAIAVDDYRDAVGVPGLPDGLGPPPAYPRAARAHERACRAVESLHLARYPEHDHRRAR